jgi:hypothetical protein
MEIKVKKLILIFALLANAILLYSQAKLTDSAISSQRGLLKDYALCKCVNYGFKEDNLLKKDFSATVLVEQLDYNPEVFVILDSLMKKFAYTIPISKYADEMGKRGVMINCINYYNSKEFDSLINGFDHYLQVEK